MNTRYATLLIGILGLGSATAADLLYCVSDSSTPIRMEARTDFGGRLVRSAVTFSTLEGPVTLPGIGALAFPWQSNAAADGWHTFTQGSSTAEMRILNDSGVAVQGGRLSADATWSSDALHLVRNWVVVPSGITLTLNPGAIVKFTSSTGIQVESGGKLAFAGTQAAPIILTSASDDTIGGDTDGKTVNPAGNTYTIVIGGTFTDTGWCETRYLAADTSLVFPSLSLENALATWANGTVYVPVTVSGSRTLPFSVIWEATDGSTIHGRDYLQKTGTITWNTASDGTKYIAIPLDRTQMPESNRTFTIRFTSVYGAALAQSSATVTLYVGRAVDIENMTFAESVWSSEVALNACVDGNTFLTSGSEPLLYSTAWAKAASVNLWQGGTLLKTSTGNGIYDWSATQPGNYTLYHQSLNASGEEIETLSASLTLLDPTLVAIHRGTLTANEIWSADRVHLIDSDFTIPKPFTLTIEPGAVVKFMPGASLSVNTGAFLIANSVVFTPVADDTVGGDTLMDGSTSFPAVNSYSLNFSGSVTMDDKTELRYTLQKTSGTLSSSTLWRGHQVYHVTGNLTIANGATLTILPGAIVKFDSGTSLTVNSGGTLNAIGTRATPIIFTSIKDDSCGGDTNEDGSATYAQPGDWNQIRVSGTANFEHARVFYCSATNNQGGIYPTAGTTIFNNGIVAHCAYDCVRTTGGTFTAQNSIFTDSSMGIAPAGGNSTFINCVIYDVTTAVRWGSGTFINCAFYRVSSIFEEWGPSAFRNCSFYNNPDYGPQSCSQTGNNGNIWANPLFTNAKNWDFHIAENSPCVDAGDGSVAPETDYYGQPRQNIHAEATGTPDANGRIPDIGIHEVIPRNAVSDIDFAVVSVNASESAVSGGEITVTWVVENEGVADINGSWRDTVSLVSRSGQSIELGTVVTSGYIAHGGTKTITRTFTVPALSEGDWTAKVVVNAQRDIWEGSLTANNTVTAATATTITVNAGSAVDGFSGTLASGDFTLIKLSGEEALNATLQANSGVKLYYGVGFVPTEQNHFGSITCDATGAILGLPAGDIYLLIVNDGKTGSNYSLSFTAAELLIRSATPNLLPASGSTSLLISGVNFTDATTVAFASGAQRVEPESIRALSASQLSVRVNCALFQPGKSYDVLVTDGAATATLSQGIRIEGSAVAAKANLVATLDVPSSVRQGRTLTVYVDYENTGNIDMPAPILEIVSQGQVFHIGNASYTNSVKIIGLSKDAPCGTLRPHEPQRVGVEVTVGTSSAVSWKLRSYHSGQPSAQTALTLEALVSPDWVRWLATESDGATYQELKGLTGHTWTEFYANLASFINEYYYADEQDLLGYENAVTFFVGNVYEQIFGFEAEFEEVDTFRAEKKSATACSLPSRLTGTSYKNDNSVDGDIWWYHSSCGGWHKATDPIISANIDKNNALLICHGNANSVHENWIASMAKASMGYSVLAVDWGDTSQTGVSLTNFLNWGAKKTATAIPGIAEVSAKTLMWLQIKPAGLTIVGHSHGAHLGGTIARHMGKIKRFVGLDASPLWTHQNASSRYPSAWSSNIANRVDFYKTSWSYSMGTSVPFELFGQLNFYIPRGRKDFYEDWGYGDTGMSKNRHIYATSWFSNLLLWNHIIMEKDSANDVWTALSGGVSGRSGQMFLGTLRGEELECGVQIRNKVAQELGKSASEVNWRYEDAILKVNSNSSQRPSTLKTLQNTMALVTEYNLRSFVLSTAQGGQNQFLVNEPVSISLLVDNLADNLSTSYDLWGWKSGGPDHLPWKVKDGSTYGIGHGVWIFDLTHASSSALTIVERVKNGQMVLSADEVAQLKTLNYCTLMSDSPAKSSFIYPEESGRAVNKTIDLKLNFPGRTRGIACNEVGEVLLDSNEQPTGEEFLVLAISGAKILHNKTPSIEFYPHELCYDNNSRAEVITVYADSYKPTAIISEGYVNYTAKSYAAPIKKASSGFDDAGAYSSDTNGYWTVQFNGAESFSNTNLVRWIWATVDCAASPEFSRTNPNTTLSGRLPFIGGSDPRELVPSKEYYLGLLVEDALGRTATNFYSFVVNRGVADEEGEDEDGERSAVPQSCDPNEMAGPVGEGEARYVKPGQWMNYTVYFENKEDATAAAQEVWVTNPLSPWLDWETFEMGEVVYHNQVEMGLSGKKNGSVTSALKDTSYQVKSQLELDETTGEVKWYLRIVDPSTNDGWPTDVYAGFLPPNDPETHIGEGHLSYRIRLREDAPPMTVISNAAEIIFDYNEMIPTDPSWWNTVLPEAFEAAFTSSAILVDEGETARIPVMGGNAQESSSVKYWILPGTAGTSDYTLPKPHPGVISWAAGEMGEKEILIPVKADKAVEGEEFFTVLLGAPQGMEIGSNCVCTVSIRDLNSAETLQNALGGTTLKWSTAGGAKWVPVKDESAADGSTVVSVPMAKGKASTLSTSVKGLGMLTFRVKIEDEAGDSLLELFDGKASLEQWQGAMDWTSISLPLGAGSHALKWLWVQGSDPEARVYIDAVVFSPEGAEMVAVEAKASDEAGGMVFGSGMYPAGAKISLSAKVLPGWVFKGWEGYPFTKPASVSQSITVSEPVAVVARFEKTPYVRGLPSPAEGGTVSGSGLCKAGKTITLTAKPAKNFTFEGWSDGIATASRKVSADSDITLTAIFKPYPKITVSVEPAAGGSISGAGSYLPGKKVTLKATPAKGYAFIQWDTGNPNASFALTSTEADQAFTATFKAIADIPPPVIEGAENQTAMVGIPFELALGIASEALPTVSISGLPSGLSFDKASLAIRGRATKAGTFTATIKAINTGGASTASFTLTVQPLPAWATGTFMGLAGIDLPTLGGRLDFTLNATGGITGSLDCESAKYTFKSTLSGTPEQPFFTAELSRGKNRQPLLLTVALEEAIEGTAWLDDPETQGQINLSFWQNRQKLEPEAFTPFVGQWNFQLEPAQPEDGVGYLTVTIKPGSAIATIAGRLADNTALSGTTLIVPQADGSLLIPIWLAAKKSGIVLTGTMHIQDGLAIADPAELLIWMPGEHPLTPTGGLYTSPTTDWATLWADGRFLEVYWSDPIATSLFHFTRDTATPQWVDGLQAATLTVTRKTGLFTGKLTPLEARTTTPYYGLLAPAPTGLHGAGYTLAPSGPRSIRLTPPE